MIIDPSTTDDNDMVSLNLFICLMNLKGLTALIYVQAKDTNVPQDSPPSYDYATEGTSSPVCEFACFRTLWSLFNLLQIPMSQRKLYHLVESKATI